MVKSPDAFRTISEVAEWLGVQAHVLRFWESKFTQVKPVKRAGGRRYYRPSDMLLLGGIKKLLHDDGLTIKGVQKALREQSVAHVSSLSQDLCDGTEAAVDAPVDAPGEASGETSGGDAVVVPFKSSVAQPDPEPASAPPIQTPPAPEVSDAKGPQDTTPPVALPDPVPPAPVSAEPSQQAEPVAESKPEPSAPVQELPILPSFLHRPAREAEPQTPAESPAEPVVARIRPNVVEAPDPPDENDLPQLRGPLTVLASLDRLTAAQVAEITPLAAELQAWLTRSRGAGAS